MKRRTNKFVLLTAIALVAIVTCPANANVPNLKYTQKSESMLKQDREAMKKRYEKEMLTQKTVSKMLDGKEAIVRVYNNWQQDFRQFSLVPIRLNGLYVTFDTVKSAFPQLAASAIIVVFPQDQTDKSVALVLGDYFHATAYKEKGSLSIWPDTFAAKSNLWTFTDALGQAIPNAAVEVLISNFIVSNWQISLCKARLDGQGKLKFPSPSIPAPDLTFVLSHPDYGTAGTQSRSPTYNPPSDKTYVVPLVRIDSDAGSRAVSGFVIDSQNNPVSEVTISCNMIKDADGQQLPIYSQFRFRFFTDNRGWFAAYMPIEENGLISKKLLPAMAKYELSIEPPKSLHLYSDLEWITAGTEKTIVLSAMDPNQYFHTFAFEDKNFPITDQELNRIIITLYRDGREWTSLKYDNWKNGCYLTTGRLRASMSRWGEQYYFEPFELQADSPQEIAFKSADPIIYTGKVVNTVTGEAMPNVLVVMNPLDSKIDASSMQPEQWEILRNRLIQNPKGYPSSSELHNYWDRVVVTDANGCYQVTFIPCLRYMLGQFVAIERGYVAQPASVSYQNPNKEGIIQVPTITMTPPKLIKPKRQRPDFVFEDESGPVTDPNLLHHVKLQMGGYGWTYSGWMNEKRFLPGTYEATALWNDKYYIFEPVQVTEESPQTLTFKIKEVKTDSITYRGQVVYAITGQPMPGVIVMNCKGVPEGDISALETQQWNDISVADTHPDPDNLAFVLLKEIFDFKKITRTGQDGWFQLTFGPGTIQDDDEIIVVEKDYLAVHQNLKYYYVAVYDPQIGRQKYEQKEFELDPNNRIILSPMRLFPSATIIIDPHINNLPNYKSHRFRFHWFIYNNQASPSADDFRAYHNWYIFYKHELQPNTIQTAYVPAGFPVTLKVYPLLKEWGTTNIGPINLKQGQILNLGQVNFQPTFKVAVKVISSQNQPLRQVPVRHLDENNLYWGQTSTTDEKGIAWLYVAPNSKGRFALPQQTSTPANNLFGRGIDYQIAGPEEQGKEFTLQLSDQLFQELFKDNKSQ